MSTNSISYHSFEASFLNLIPVQPKASIPPMPSHTSIPVSGVFFVIAEAVAAASPVQKQLLSETHAGFRHEPDTQAKPALQSIALLHFSPQILAPGIGVGVTVGFTVGFTVGAKVATIFVNFDVETGPVGLGNGVLAAIFPPEFEPE